VKRDRLDVLVVVPDARSQVDRHQARPEVGVDRLRLAKRDHDLDHANAVVLGAQVV
jgi:hypothetical protein